MISIYSTNKNNSILIHGIIQRRKDMTIVQSDPRKTCSIVLIVIGGNSDDLRKEYDTVIPGFSTENDIIACCNEECDVIRIFYTADDFLKIPDSSLMTTIMEMAHGMYIDNKPPRIEIHLQSYGYGDDDYIKEIAVQEQYDRVTSTLLNL